MRDVDEIYDDEWANEQIRAIHAAECEHENWTLSDSLDGPSEWRCHDCGDRADRATEPEKYAAGALEFQRRWEANRAGKASAE